MGYKFYITNKPKFILSKILKLVGLNFINTQFLLIIGFRRDIDCASEESGFWVDGPESAVGNDEKSIVKCPGKCAAMTLKWVGVGSAMYTNQRLNRSCMLPAIL